MNKSTIAVNVVLDENKLPESISWSADNSTADNPQNAGAMMLAFWDKAEKSAMRIDLWTKEMMIDEMTDFFYQTFMTMADTYGRATHQQDMVKDMKLFAKEFYQKANKITNHEKRITNQTY